MQAIGYGKLVGDAVIGEPLHVEIPLVGSLDRPVGKECINLQRVSDPTDLEYFPRDLGVRLDTQGSTPRIVVTNQSAIRQPLVEFRVSVSCGYNVSRDFLLMAAPRKGNTSGDVSTTTLSTLPASASGRNGGSQKTADSGSAAVTVSAISSPTSIARLPDGLSGKNIVLEEDMTLEQLAKRYFPGPLRQQRFMRWVAEANPELFNSREGLRNKRLHSGTSLIIPDGVPPRRPGDHQGAINPIGEQLDTAAQPSLQADRVEKTAIRSSDQGGKTAPAGPSKDRLVVGGASRNMKEAIAIVDQLTGMMEKQVETQAAYNEKIKELEATVTDLGGRLKGMEADAAKREVEWQAAKAERELEAEESWWKLLAAVVGGGLVGAGALFGLSSLFGRKKAGRDEDSLDTRSAPMSTPAPSIAPDVPRADPVVKFAWEDNLPADDRHADLTPADNASHSGLAPAKVQKTSLPDVEFDMPENHDTAYAADDIPSDPAKAAIELASIMTSMGLAESAAQTLVEYIRENPKESLPQWLKLLEIHRISGNRTEFERSATELRQQFNIKPDEWSEGESSGRDSLEAYTHVRTQLVKLWRTPECTDFLRSLLQDNREGTRLGFPLPVVEDILLLVAILNSNE